MYGYFYDGVFYGAFESQALAYEHATAEGRYAVDVHPFKQVAGAPAPAPRRAQSADAQFLALGQ